MKQYKKLFAVLTLLCFALTLMPVAAFAATTIDYQESTVFTEDSNASEDTGDALTIQFDLAGTTDTIYVWFTKGGSTGVASTSVDVYEGGTNEDSIEKVDNNGVFKVSSPKSGIDYDFTFNSSGTYYVHAALNNPMDLYGKTYTTLRECFDNVEYQLGSISGQYSFEITSSSNSQYYSLELVHDADLAWGIAVGDAIANGGSATIGAGANTSTNGVNNHLEPNGVPSDDITFKVLDEEGKAVKGATVKLSTSNSNCVVNKSSVTTDSLGRFSFTITILEESPNTDGFTVYIECGSYEAQLKITASSTSAYSLTQTQAPTGPISTDDATAGSALDAIWIAAKDVNGNFVKPFALQPGGDYAEPGFAGVVAEINNAGTTDFNSVTTYKNGDAVNGHKAWGTSAEDYVSIISQPSGSKLENGDIWMSPVGVDAPYQNTLYTKKDLVAGDYSIKCTLQNGKSLTVNFTVAEMGTPVGITITPKAAVTELGSKTTASVKLVDANGITCDALKKGTDVAVSGYGVAESTTDSEDTVTIYTKNDDKYAGSEIKIVATNDRYNLVSESTITLTSGNAFIYMTVSEAKINTPTDITYLLMDGQNMMNIGTGTTTDYLGGKAGAEAMLGGAYESAAKRAIYAVGGQTSFVVVAKPEGATVNFDARAAGGAITSITGDSYAMGRIECDKPGVVTVQMNIGVEILQDDGTWSPRYYTGTQNIVFSDGSIGKTVVMSIGSSEIVVDGEKATIDAAPVVQNSRTYVPFRALAEAFGAEVAYDEATQAVTATLGSTTVVMTIGSAAYTVNGEEKTADVAPFISGGRTMVPVRFAAEAFGSTVIPTYDDNGATADVLFKL